MSRTTRGRGVRPRQSGSSGLLGGRRTGDARRPVATRRRRALGGPRVRAHDEGGGLVLAAGSWLSRPAPRASRAARLAGAGGRCDGAHVRKPQRVRHPPRRSNLLGFGCPPVSWSRGASACNHGCVRSRGSLVRRRRAWGVGAVQGQASAGIQPLADVTEVRTLDRSIYLRNARGAITRLGPGDGLPVAVATGQLAVGSDHACALSPSHELSCWGANDVGQISPRATAAGFGVPIAAGVEKHREQGADPTAA